MPDVYDSFSTPDQRLLEALPDAKFVERDPEVLTQQIIDQFETLLDRSLYPAQIERIMADFQAYREGHIRQAIQYTGEQNLVYYAEGYFLDLIGARMGVYRLGETPSIVTLRFTFSDNAEFSEIEVPRGTIVAPRVSFNVRWVTQETRVIYPKKSTIQNALDEQGRPYVEIKAKADKPGIIGNGFAPGEITELVGSSTQIYNLVDVQNVDQSRFGTATESDERLAERIVLSVGKWSSGSDESYRYKVLSISNDVLDVGIKQIEPGRVGVYPLMSSGLPDMQTLLEISDILRPESSRPLTDWVSVLAPAKIDYAIDLDVWVFEGSIKDVVLQKCRRALDSYLSQANKRLGIDIVPSAINKIAKVSGVYRVIVNSPVYRKLEANEWGYCDSVTLNFQGFEYG